MKLWVRLLSVFLVFTLFFTPSKIQAKSGCCSGHGGVSCGAGPQRNGNVICLDGWTGSSCSYSGMVMCGGSNPVPTNKPVIIVTRIPTRTPTEIPTSIPTIEPTTTPSSTLTPTLTPTDTPEPQVLGEKTTASPTTPPKTSDYIITLSFFGLIGFGIYKLINKIKKS